MKSMNFCTSLFLHINKVADYQMQKQTTALYVYQTADGMKHSSPRHLHVKKLDLQDKHNKGVHLQVYHVAAREARRTEEKQDRISRIRWGHIRLNLSVHVIEKHF